MRQFKKEKNNLDIKRAWSKPSLIELELICSKPIKKFQWGTAGIQHKDTLGLPLS